MINFWVEGEPRPKQSYRALKRGGGYQPERVKAWQGMVRARAREAMQGREPISGNVSVVLNFSLGDKRRTDPDNLSKGTLDALREVVYLDDCQIVDLHVTKAVSEPAGVEIFVEEVKGA